MPELSPIEKLKIIEDDFQKWFRKAYELKDATDIDINSLVSNLPKVRLQRRASVPRTLYFKEQFKSTIKIPPQFQDRPKVFINLLGKYFLDSSKFLYKEQIRYEYSGFVSSSPGDHCNIAIYKTCGNEIGSVDVKFRLEGNLVVSEVGYQIFHQIIPLLSHPNQLLTFSSEALGKSGRRELCSYFPQLLMKVTEENYWKYERSIFWFFYILAFPCSFLLWFGSFMSEGGDASFEKVGFATVFSLVSSLIATGCIELLISTVVGFFESQTTRFFKNPWLRNRQLNIALEQDLSAIHLPVKYFDHKEFSDGFAESHDHQIFLKQLVEVVNRMSALGESSNSL